MLYAYRCSACHKEFDESFSMGKAVDVVPCPTCGNDGKRSFSRMSFVLKGGGFPSSDLRFKNEMTKRNAEAGRRMKSNRPPVRRVATDYGGGDVRGV